MHVKISAGKSGGYFYYTVPGVGSQTGRRLFCMKPVAFLHSRAFLREKGRPPCITGAAGL